MNARTVIAADGLPRRLFTVADVERMVEVGLIDEDERIELVEGELVPMSPEGNEHEVWKHAILEAWFPRCPKPLRLAVETTLRLSADTFLEPDVLVMPRRVGFAGLDAASTLLALEIGASSLGYDLGRKAAIYARSGVRELWVVDPASRAIHVHRDPAADGYGTRTVVAADGIAVPISVPELALRLADLDLGP